jgi:hypothetical protein
MNFFPKLILLVVHAPGINCQIYLLPDPREYSESTLELQKLMILPSWKSFHGIKPKNFF